MFYIFGYSVLLKKLFDSFISTLTKLHKRMLLFKPSLIFLEPFSSKRPKPFLAKPSIT